MIPPIIAALSLALSATGCLTGIIALLRTRRISRTLAAYLRVWELINGSPPPPEDGGRKRHLRIVAGWIPFAGIVGWLACRVHPAVGAAAALTVATATVATLVVVVPHRPTDNVGLPATAPHRGGGRTYSQQPQDRAPQLGTSRLSTSSARPVTRPVLLPQSPPEPPSRFPVPSMLPTMSPLPPTTGSTLPLPTIPPPTITTTVQVPPRQPLLCLDVGLPLATVALDLGDCTSGED